MGGNIPIILLSGMAADERLFESQLIAFPNLRVQPSAAAHRKHEGLCGGLARLIKNANRASSVGHRLAEW